MNIFEDIRFTESKNERSAKLFRALGHPIRMEMVRLLSKNEHCVSEIQKELSLLQAMTSQHLRILYQAGVISRRKIGVNVYYQVTSELSGALLVQFQTIDDFFHPNKNASRIAQNM